MISKARRGNGFRGLRDYLLGDDMERLPSPESYRLVNVVSLETGPAEMRYVAAQSKCKKPNYHLIIAPADQDKITDEQLFQSGIRMIRDLGLKDHQAIMILHNDGVREGQPRHLHAIINLVHPINCRADALHHDFARREKIVKEISKDLGLTKIRGRVGMRSPEQPSAVTAMDLPRTRSTSTARRMAKIAGIAGHQNTISEQIFRDPILADRIRATRSMGDLAGVLAESGITIQGSTGKRAGHVLVADDGRIEKLSALGIGGLRTLEARFAAGKRAGDVLPHREAEAVESPTRKMTRTKKASKKERHRAEAEDYARRMTAARFNEMIKDHRDQERRRRPEMTGKTKTTMTAKQLRAARAADQQGRRDLETVARIMAERGRQMPALPNHRKPDRSPSRQPRPAPDQGPAR